MKGRMARVVMSCIKQDVPAEGQGLWHMEVFSQISQEGTGCEDFKQQKVSSSCSFGICCSFHF